MKCSELQAAHLPPAAVVGQTIHALSAGWPKSRQRRGYAPGVAAEVHFAIHDERGAEILDELERRTEVGPYLAIPTERLYNLDADNVTTSGFDAMLDRIADDWREHLDRTADPA